MTDSQKLIALKKAYAEIILNTAKEAAARVMVAEKRAFRYQRELADAKEDALRMMLRLKNIMDSRIYEADITASRQLSKIEELEAQLHEAEDIVKDLREELSIVKDELYDTKKKLPQRTDVQQANYIVISGQEEEAPPSICDDNLISNTQVEHLAPSDLWNLPDQRISESNQCGALHVCTMDLAPNIVPPKELHDGLPQIINGLINQDLDNDDDLHGKTHLAKDDSTARADLRGKPHLVTDDSTVREDFKDSGKFMMPTSSADLCISKRRSHTRMKKVKKSNVDISLAMKIRAHNLRFKKTNTRSCLNKRRLTKVLKSLKKTYLVTVQPSPTSVVQSEMLSAAVREPEGQKGLGLSPDTADFISNSGLCRSLKPCSIQSTLENDKSNKDKASTGDENGSAESSITCVDTEIACAPPSSIVEESEELTVDDALRLKNDSSIKFTFQRKRKKECMGSADDSHIVEVVKRSSDEETVVILADSESDATGIFSKSSQQNDDKEDTLKEFKRALKKMNVEKQEMKGSMKRMDIEVSTDIQPKVIGIVPNASRGSRRLAQVARQLLSMSEKKCWD